MAKIKKLAVRLLVFTLILGILSPVIVMLPFPAWAINTAMLATDDAYISNLRITGYSDGVGPFDADNAAGNDADANNKIVRSFDSVTYTFDATMLSRTESIYSEGHVKLEFVIPLNEKQASFDQAAMAWMGQGEGYQPTLTTETRVFDGESVECQVLTCYKHLKPTEGNYSVIPGSFSNNVTVKVKQMANGQKVPLEINAAMEFNTWDGECPEHGAEKKTVRAEDITVSAAPKYNILSYVTSAYRDTFNFKYGDPQYNTDFNGRTEKLKGHMNRMGIVLQLYNDSESKGLKGIEVPTGDITFDVQLSNEYCRNHLDSDWFDPNLSWQSTDTHNYSPLLWSCDVNMQGMWDYNLNTYVNKEGRPVKSSFGSAYDLVPFANNESGAENSCYKSGDWSAVQENGTIKVTVSGYEIDPDKMPTKVGGGNTKVAYGANVGCFSAGEVWFVQPFQHRNIGANDTNLVSDLWSSGKAGKFDVTASVQNFKATSLSGAEVTTQMVTTDDKKSVENHLDSNGSLSNRIYYANKKEADDRIKFTNNSVGSGGGLEQGDDFASVGTEFYAVSGFNYNDDMDDDNRLYAGLNLMKFDADVFEINGSPIRANFESWD